jgi:hypothetical protein
MLALEKERSISWSLVQPALESDKLGGQDQPFPKQWRAPLVRAGTIGRLDFPKPRTKTLSRLWLPNIRSESGISPARKNGAT